MFAYQAWVENGMDNKTDTALCTSQDSGNRCLLLWWLVSQKSADASPDISSAFNLKGVASSPCQLLLVNPETYPVSENHTSR